MVTELTSVERLRIRSYMMQKLEAIYGSFPLPETIARHKQLNLFPISKQHRRKFPKAYKMKGATA